MGYNKLKALHDNVLAIQTAWQLCLQMRNANAEEKAVLEKYSGFGGIKEVLVSFDNIDKTFEYSANVAKGRQDIESIDESDKITVECRNLSNIIYSIAAADKSIYRNIVQSVKTSVLTAFYTPKELRNKKMLAHLRRVILVLKLHLANLFLLSTPMTR